jgi:acyl-CoA thioester hydrolase
MAAQAPTVAAGRQPEVILARLEVDYLRQLYYRVGERLRVHSWITRMGTKSFTMRQELVQDGEVAIRLDAVLVVFDAGTGTSRALTGEERAFWGRYLQE